MILFRCTSLICLSLLSISVLGCEPSSREPEESTQSEQSPPTLSDEQTSYSQSGKIEDVSYGNVKRVSGRIVVPLDRTKEELTATLNRAAREIGKETNANAVMVFAYRPQDDPSGQYTAGRAVYAPNGKWEEATSSAPMRVSVDLNDLYFAPPTNQIAIGETVRLKTSLDDVIAVSKEYGSWSDEDIIDHVPVGTEATILERRSEPMGDQEFIRYHVRVTHAGREINGWVHQSSVEGK